MRLEQVEHDDGHLVVHAEAEGRGVHDLELLLQRFEISDAGVAHGLGVFLRVAVVDAINLGGLKNDLGAHLVGPQGGGGVGGEIRIARAGGEDDHAPLLQMAHGAATDERLGNLRHVDGALHAGRHAMTFERILQGQRVDDRGQHAHVISRGALDAFFAARHAAKDVPAPDDDDQLQAQSAHLADLRGHVRHARAVDAIALRVAEGFAGKFEEDAAVFGLVRFHGRVN